VPAHLRVITRHALLTYARKHWPGWHFLGLAGLIALEAGLRRLLAGWAGRAEAARAFGALGLIARHLARGEVAEAGTRLRRVVREQEERHAAPTLGRH